LRGLFAAMRRYLEHRARLGNTEQGLYNTERYIRDFIQWADERGVTHPHQVSRAVLERYQRWLYHYRKKDGEPLHVRSQRGKIVPLKGFFKWLTKTAEIPANPASDLDLPREIHRIPRQVLTAEDAQRVLSLADTGTLVGLRDRAMMEVLYATGMRRMELAQLAMDDIEPQRCVVLIRQGKGHKDRLIPLGERALHWVRRYLEEVRPQLAWNANDKTLFLGYEGRPLNPAWLSTVVAGYATRADVGKLGGCHLWRHTMATLMLEGGADIRFIQAMLGHADINSTQIYTQVAIRQLTQVHAMTHPGVHLRRKAESVNAATGDIATTPASESNNAAAALLEVLADEAIEDAET
jgi:integrase/recombinase XerD